MHEMIAEQYSFVTGSLSLRDQMLALLTDADLAFAPTNNPTLGALLREMGQMQRSYIDSFTTFRQSFAYPAVEAELESSLERLKAWFAALDADLSAALSNLSEADITSKGIDRGGYPVPVRFQLDVLVQAFLIYFGKATVYLRIMGKTLPQQWQDWIG
jgi:hypothetical protein